MPNFARNVVSGVEQVSGTVDHATNGAVFLPRRISQTDEPTLASGELAIWYDSDLTGVFLLYNDPTAGQVKLQLS